MLVEAPAGFGKRTFASQLGALPGTAVVPTLEDGLASADERSARRLVVRSVRSDVTAAEVLRVVERTTADTIVLCTSHVPVPLRWSLDGIELLDLDWRDLRFSTAEIEELATASLPRDVALAFVELMAPFTEGWPAAVTASLQMVARSAEPFEAMRSVVSAPMHIRELVDRFAHVVAPQRWHALTQLAHLGSFSESVASALLGSDGVDAVRGVGFPLLPDEQRLRMSLAVAEVLRSIGPLEPETVARLTPALIADGSLLTALRLLVSVGGAGDAADLVVSTGPSRLDDVEQVRLLSILDLLGAEAARVPRLHLIRARVERNLARLAASRASLDAAERGADATGDRELALEARIERLLATALSGVEDDGLVGEIERLRTDDGDLDVRLRLRLREIDAVRLAQQPDPAAVQEASTALREVAIQWEHLGDTARAAATIRVLASGALSHLGHYREAQEQLRRASELTWNKAFDRLLTAELSARLDVLAGDLDAHERSVAEAESLLSGLEIPWIEAYLSWWKMLAASQRADRAAVATLFHRCERLLGELLSGQTGAVFNAEAAVAFALAGETEQATELVELALSHPNADPVEANMAAVIVHARAGDLDAALARHEELVASGRLPPDRLWRPVLELVRAGADGIDRRTARNATAAVSGLGLEELVAQLGLVTSDEAPSAGADAAAPMTVSVLGGFSVTVDGGPVAVPPGHVARLLKLLAVRPAGVAVEVAIDLLWPDMAEVVGRRRLKNVVNRLRGTVGQTMIRRDRGTLGLDPSVEVDLVGFERAVTSALLTGPPGDTAWVDAAVRALSAYRGELLPDDPYDDWLATERLSARSRAVAVLERLLDAGPRVGPPAPWLLDAALRIDTESTRLYVALADRAVAEQQLGCAEAALGHARSVADALGVDVGRDILAVEERISA